MNKKHHNSSPMPLTPSSTIEERECAIERLLASVRRRMDKASGEVTNDPISEGEVERLTGPAGKEFGRGKEAGTGR